MTEKSLAEEVQEFCDEALERIRSLQAALMRYGEHLDWCSLQRSGIQCTCGLDQAKGNPND